MKRYVDLKRHERTFHVGDWVYLKLQPCRQASVKGKMGTHKLQSKFYGPFEILERTGQVAYKLNLPSGSLIHPVFHVSQFKKKKRLGPAVPVNNSLPLVGTNGQVKLEPVAILDRRIVKKNNQVGVEIPVQWSNLDLEDATLEDYDQLKIQFPLSKLEDKLKGKGNVMSAHGLERLGTVVSLNSKIVPKGDGAREAGQELGMGCVEQTV
jgi:hypothetical protein